MNRLLNFSFSLSPYSQFRPPKDTSRWCICRTVIGNGHYNEISRSRSRRCRYRRRWRHTGSTFNVADFSRNMISQFSIIQLNFFRAVFIAQNNSVKFLYICQFSVFILHSLIFFFCCCVSSDALRLMNSGLLFSFKPLYLHTRTHWKEGKKRSHTMKNWMNVCSKSSTTTS